jgi:hypothetical protein
MVGVAVAGAETDPEEPVVQEPTAGPPDFEVVLDPHRRAPRGVIGWSGSFAGETEPFRFLTAARIASSPR